MGKHRVAAAALVTACAVTGVVAGGIVGTGTAEAQSIAGSHKTKSVPGGSVSIRLTDQKVAVSNSVANNPFSREVFVSGKVQVTTTGDIKGATVTPAYLVGCQLNFGAEGGAEGEYAENDEGEYATDSSGEVSVALGPGEAKTIPLIALTDDDGDNVNSFSFSGGKGGITYSKERFGVDGCAGFAQARALVNVKVASDTFKGSVTLYGKPFSIG